MLRRLVGVLLALVLASCAGLNIEDSDSRPARPITAADVAEPIPRPDPILAVGNTSPYSVYGVEYKVLASSQGYRQQGIASWYGHKFHGRSTANGEVYNAYAATAAHRTLPIPCFVRVTNLENGQSMIVRVNDRGPFHAERIIDLSYGAAVKLGFADRGTTSVEVVALSVDGVKDLRGSAGPMTASGVYRYLQVGSFGDRDSARRLSEQLLVKVDAPVTVAELKLAGTTWHRVRIGPIDDQVRLAALQLQLQQMGYPNARMMPD